MPHSLRVELYRVSVELYLHAAVNTIFVKAADVEIILVIFFQYQLTMISPRGALWFCPFEVVVKEMIW